MMKNGFSQIRDSFLFALQKQRKKSTKFFLTKFHLIVGKNSVSYNDMLRRSQFP